MAYNYNKYRQQRPKPEEVETFVGNDSLANEEKEKRAVKQVHAIKKEEPRIIEEPQVVEDPPQQIVPPTMKEIEAMRMSLPQRPTVDRGSIRGSFRPKNEFDYLQNNFVENKVFENNVVEKIVENSVDNNIAGQLLPDE